MLLDVKNAAHPPIEGQYQEKEPDLSGSILVRQVTVTWAGNSWFRVHDVTKPADNDRFFLLENLRMPDRANVYALMQGPACVLDSTCKGAWDDDPMFAYFVVQIARDEIRIAEPSCSGEYKDDRFIAEENGAKFDGFGCMFAARNSLMTALRQLAPKANFAHTFTRR